MKNTKLLAWLLGTIASVTLALVYNELYLQLIAVISVTGFLMVLFKIKRLDQTSN